MKTKITRWEGCYESRWQGVITPASMAHPAKYSRDLIERIFDHCLEQGWIEKGAVIGDPFGGVGTGGVTAAYRGLIWRGVELEAKFVEMAESNFALHCSRWRALGVPAPSIIKGDSRRFHEIVQAAAVVTSPPYAESIHEAGNKNWVEQPSATQAKHGNKGYCGQLQKAGAGYGSEDGQIGALPSGSVDACITSPPFTQGYSSGGGINVKGYGDGSDKVGQRTYQGTGGDRSVNNIEKLSAGAVEAVITSPPWENNCEGGIKAHKLKMAPTEGKGHYGSPEARKRQLERDEQKTYGDTPGNIGNDSKETYWAAMKAVYASCHLAIKPGGLLVCVLKDYVKAGKRVPLCDDTARLLEHLGFTIVERIHAMLTQETEHADMFADGGKTVTTRQRKSFFRRLHERRPGAVKIDWEEVLIARKPL